MDTTAQDAAERAHKAHSAIVEHRYYFGPKITQITRMDGATMCLSSAAHSGDRVRVAWNTQAPDGRVEDTGIIDMAAGDPRSIDRRIGDWAKEITPDPDTEI